jgi:hypothetical protein
MPLSNFLCLQHAQNLSLMCGAYNWWHVMNSKRNHNYEFNNLIYIELVQVLQLAC